MAVSCQQSWPKLAKRQVYTKKIFKKEKQNSEEL